MTEYLTTLACIAGAIGIVVALFAPLADLIAPLGYEDEDGFHLGVSGSVHNERYTNREVQDHGA